MAKVTVSKIISTAKSLLGKDKGGGCDIMKWYGTFSTSINSVACCCAGQMYLFNKAGALSMIPGGKTASCGALAQNFYNAGQLYKPDKVKVGDLVLFSWSGNSTTWSASLKKAGYKSFDHVELCIAVNSNGTITTIGANNGGSECDDFQQKTRYKSNISACCRPKYAKSKTTAKPQTVSIPYSPAVEKWQHAMNIGFDFTGDRLVEDGLFGSASEAFAKKHVIYKGIKNAPTAVKWVQKAVGVTQDGIFGKNTESAVKAFQKKNKLTADGEVGVKTVKAILKIK